MNNLSDPTITAFKTESGIITAHNLLHCYLEFVVLVPDIEDWTEEQLSDNPPRLYRLKQLNSMLHAFQIDGLLSFQSGQFIELDKSSRYAKALSLISAGKISSDRSKILAECFNILMVHRQEVESVLWFGSGAYHVGSRLLSSTYQRIWSFNWSFRQHIRTIDHIIVAIISPEEKSFTTEFLVRDHAFPDVDITAIDLDWL
jgi:hypothetical protein